MHHSRLCALLVDCRTDNVDAAADFWAKALGRPVDPKHPGTRGNYLMLETPADEPIVQIQRVDHESRVHIDIETDDIPAEVARELIEQAIHLLVKRRQWTRALRAQGRVAGADPWNQSSSGHLCPPQ